MERQPIEYRGWELTTYRGRPWIGSAKQERPPYDVHVVKGFSEWSVLAALRQKVDAIEDRAADRADHSGIGGSGSTESQG